MQWFKRILSVSVALLATGCVQAETLTMGTSLWVGYSPFYIAQAKGYFKAEGLTINEKFFSVGSDSTVAFGAGRVDGLLSVVSDTLVLAVRGKKVKNLIIADYSNGADGVVARGVTSMKELRGKRVAVEFGTVWQYVLMRALAINGLTDKDITLTNASGDAGTAAFIGGQLDALAIGEPNLSLAAQRGKGNIIFDSRQLPGEVIDGVSFDADYVAKHPDDIKKFMRAWFKGVDLITTNPKEASEIVAKILKITPQKVLDLLKVDHILTLQENKEAYYNPKSPLNVLRNARRNGEFLQQRGVIPQLPDLVPMHENPFLKGLK